MGRKHKQLIRYCHVLIHQCREPGSIFNAMAPTYMGGMAVVVASWAFCEPLPWAIGLGLFALALGFATVRMFMNSA
jgi:hypothetical protein